MKRSANLGIAFALGLSLSAGASAQTAFIMRDTNVRAGPSTAYPVVERLPAGESVAVAGCLNDWSWCDVAFYGDHGWIYAGNLEYPYQDGRVPILSGGIYLNLPILTFSIGPYWDRYYRSRPWYGRRNYWELHPPHRPPMPHPPAFRPPGHRPPGWHPPGWRPRGDGHPGGGYHPGDRRPRDRHPGGGYRPGDRHPGGGHPPGGLRRDGGGGRPPSGLHRGGGGPRKPPLQPKQKRAAPRHDGGPAKDNRPH